MTDITNEKDEIEDMSFCDMLTIKQEKFAQAVVRLGSYSAAYREAYDCSNMLPTSVNRMATELMSNLKITSRVNQIKKEAAQRNMVTLDSIISQLIAIGFRNVGDFINKNGAIKSLSEVDPHKLGAVNSIKSKTVLNPDSGNIETTAEIKFDSKITALHALFDIVKPEPPREKSGAIGTVEARVIADRALQEKREYVKQQEAIHRAEIAKVIAEAENE